MTTFEAVESSELGIKLCKALGLPSAGCEKLALVCEVGQPVRVYVKALANLPPQVINDVVEIVADFTVDESGNVIVSR